jgi:hypothetical protein
MGVKPGLKLREEYRSRLSGNRVLRRLLGTKKHEIIGGITRRYTN